MIAAPAGYNCSLFRTDPHPIVVAAEEMARDAQRYREAVDRVNRMTDNGDVDLVQTEDGHHRFVDAPKSDTCFFCGNEIHDTVPREWNAGKVYHVSCWEEVRPIAEPDGRRSVDAPAEADNSPAGDAAVDALEARREGLKLQIQNCHEAIANSMTRIAQQRAIIAKYELESAQITGALLKLSEPQGQGD